MAARKGRKSEERIVLVSFYLNGLDTRRNRKRRNTERR